MEFLALVGECVGVNSVHLHCTTLCRSLYCFQYVAAQVSMRCAQAILGLNMDHDGNSVAVKLMEV